MEQVNIYIYVYMHFSYMILLYMETALFYVVMTNKRTAY